jgi:hypothetical protein
VTLREPGIEVGFDPLVEQPVVPEPDEDEAPLTIPSGPPDESEE